MFGAEDMQKDSPHTSDDENELNDDSSGSDINTEELKEEVI